MSVEAASGMNVYTNDANVSIITTYDSSSPLSSVFYALNKETRRHRPSYNKLRCELKIIKMLCEKISIFGHFELQEFKKNESELSPFAKLLFLYKIHHFNSHEKTV